MTPSNVLSRIIDDERPEAVWTVGSDTAQLRRVLDKARQHSREPLTRSVAHRSERLERLMEQWRAGTAYTSSWTEMVLHPAYVQIIGMGPAVLPYLLREMQRKPDHWGWALFAITGVNPVPAEHAGDVELIAKAWLRWGRQAGYVG